MKTPTTVVPGFPYEGGLYWLLNPDNQGQYTGTHPYYRALYGQDHALIKHRAVSLTALFDKITMAFADARLPDWDKYGGDNYDYFHPDLKLKVHPDFDNTQKWREIVERFLMPCPRIQQAFSECLDIPLETDIRSLFLERLIDQMQTARNEAAVVVGNTSFCRMYNAVLEEIRTLMIEDMDGAGEVWPLDPTLLDFVALDFKCDNLDVFASIRQNQDITHYGHKFREAIGESLTTGNPRAKLVALIKESEDKAELYKHSSGVCSTIGTAGNLGGLIPVLGFIPTAVSLVADLGTRSLTDAQYEREWYLMGQEMQHIARKDFWEKEKKRYLSEEE